MKIGENGENMETKGKLRVNLFKNGCKLGKFKEFQAISISTNKAYAVTEENMEMLWQKITAGFQRNFDRHLLASGTCSPKVLVRLDKRLGIMKQRVRGFVRAHHKWN